MRVIEITGRGDVQVCHPFLQEVQRNIGRFGPLWSLLHLVHISRAVEDDILMGRVIWYNAQPVVAWMSSCPDGRS